MLPFAFYESKFESWRENCGAELPREPVPMLFFPDSVDKFARVKRKVISRPVLEMATGGGDSEAGDAAAATVLAEVVSEEQVIIYSDHQKCDIGSMIYRFCSVPKRVKDLSHYLDRILVTQQICIVCCDFLETGTNLPMSL